MQTNGTATRPADRWCGNCAQMVAPKRSAPAMAWTVGATLALIVYWQLQVGGFTLLQPLAAWAGDWLVAVGIGVLWAVGSEIIGPRLSCPVCKSANLLPFEPRPDVSNGPIGFHPPR